MLVKCEWIGAWVLPSKLLRNSDASFKPRSAVIIYSTVIPKLHERMPNSIFKTYPLACVVSPIWSQFKFMTKLHKNFTYSSVFFWKSLWVYLCSVTVPFYLYCCQRLHGHPLLRSQVRNNGAQSPSSHERNGVTWVKCNWFDQNCWHHINC